MKFSFCKNICKKYKVRGLIYASSSSVYGKNKNIPFSVNDRVDKPISIYAVSKISNELIAFTVVESPQSQPFVFQ